MAANNKSTRATVTVGSRSSQLAMIQTQTIVEELQKLHPDIAFRIETMKTIGDQVLDRPLPNIGQTNLFTKELETALAANQIDLIVHSLKDLPTTLPPGMKLATIYKRDSPTDALVLAPSHNGRSLESLPPGAIIGTSSLRRIAQLKHSFPQYTYKSVRGNLNTRLSKLDEVGGAYDALILATAGMIRMGWKERISQEISPSTCMYAVGQGALAIETRSDDIATMNIVKDLNDPDTVITCSAERQFLKSLGGGCSVPIGVESNFSASEKGVVYTLNGAVFSLNGDKVVKGVVKGVIPAEYPSIEPCHLFGEKLGDHLAKDLIDKGAKDILQEAREETDRATQAVLSTKETIS